MPTWAVISLIVLGVAHTILNVGCMVWLWQSYHPKPGRRFDLTRQPPTIRDPHPARDWQVRPVTRDIPEWDVSAGGDR